MLIWSLACTGFTLGGAGSTDSGDTGSEPESDWCEEAHDTSEPVGPDCATGTLSCGDVVLATTEGGYRAYDGEQYPPLFCFPNLDRATYSGAERVYVVELGAQQYAEAVLSASCARLGLAVMRWPKPGSCPTGETDVTVCEGEEGTGTLAVTFGGYETENRWIVVVDTAEDDPSAFRLALTCAE